MKKLANASALLVQMAKDSPQCVINEFELYLLGRRLFRDRGYKGIKLPHANRVLTPIRARRLIAGAVEHPDWPTELGVSDSTLKRDPDLLSRHYSLKEGTAIEVAMAVDPFCYLSHRSALAWHGLTREAELHISTPNRSGWRSRVNEHMSEVLEFDVAHAEYDDLPFQFVNPQFTAKLRGVTLHRHELSMPVVPIPTHEGIRVASIGDAFRQSIENPLWCGGIRNIVRIWKRHGITHHNKIIKAVEGAPEKIVKVRAGYLLNEVLGITNPAIDNWLRYAQRGSSRKLDPSSPYASRFSERWMLSINVEDPSLPSQTL